MRYDPEQRAVVLVPYELLDPARRAAMDRFGAIGTLGLSGREQYAEVFHDLLVAHAAQVLHRLPVHQAGERPGSWRNAGREIRSDLVQQPLGEL